ncbi:hypothetical protein C8241_20360 [Paracidovorax avenae]|nr:hypothetical protein C8241_20360 [Paracidovorax avenae]
MCGISGADEADRGGPQGAWVQFIDYEGAEAPGLGHPEGLAYFCAAHHPAAQALARLPRADAVAQWRARYPAPHQESAAAPPPARPWWQFWRA